LRTGLPHSGHSVTGASLKDWTSSNSCLPSGLVQAYWYVGTAAVSLVELPWTELALSPVDCQ
jgi:hypothetical protein